MLKNRLFPRLTIRTVLAIVCVSLAILPLLAVAGFATVITCFWTRTSQIAALVVALGVPLQVHAQGRVSGTLVRGSDRVSSAVVQLIPLVQPGAEISSDTALIDQSHLRFVPGVLPLQVGSTVEFLNSDGIMHNVFSPSRGEEGFNLGTYPMGESRFHTFGTVGSYVILCHVHPEMAAWVVVSSTPFASVTRRNGSFVIDSVPAGSYEVLVWHRRWSHEAPQLDVPASGIERWTIRVGRRGDGKGVR